MPYIVPQFIERESKIVGPFTLKQFIFIGIAVSLSLFFHFILPFFLFVIISIILGVIAIMMVFLKIKGFPLPVVIKNFFIFLTREKVYVWKKKDFSPKLIKNRETKKESLKKDFSLKTINESQIKRLANFIETKSR